MKQSHCQIAMRNLGVHKIVRIKATVKPTLPVWNVPNSYRNVSSVGNSETLNRRVSCADSASKLRRRRAQPRDASNHAEWTSLFYPTESKLYVTVLYSLYLVSFEIGRLAKLQINWHVTYMDKLTEQGSQDMTFITYATITQRSLIKRTDTIHTCVSDNIL